MEILFTWIISVLLAILYIVLRRVSGRPVLYLPDALALSTGSHTLGSLLLWGERDTEATQFIAIAATLSFACVIISTLLFLISSRVPKPQLISAYFSNNNMYKYMLILVTLCNILIIIIIFSNPVLYRLIIASFTTSNETTLLVVRKAITASTEGYLAPGLIKLVRDLISPIVFVSFILSHSKAYRSTLFWIAVISTLASVMIGGQRFPMLAIILALALGFIGRRAIEGHKIRLRFGQIMRYGAAALFVFYLMSALLGRTESGGSSVDAALWSVTSLLERIFSTVPEEAEKTFVLWATIGPTWGVSWLNDLAILLPGTDGGGLSNRLHQIGGGSAEGNAPLFFAVDAWFAFGWLGIPLTALLFVTILHFIDTTLLRYRSPLNDAARIVLFLHVPLMYSPYLFLLYGGLIVLPIVGWTLVTRGMPRARRTHKRLRRA